MSGTVLVTGGSRRIGRAIVETLVRDNWSVAVHYNRSDRDAADLCLELDASGNTVRPFAADLLDERACRDLVAEVTGAIGPLIGLVNNASIFESDDAATASSATWDKHLAIHVRAPFVLTQAMAQALPDDATGAVVNIVDQRVLNPGRHFFSYSLSKMAQWDQTRLLARALAPKVRVNAVGPGPVLPSHRQSLEHFNQQAQQTPLGHAVDPVEVADAVAFLLDAPSVSGQMIAVDAGQHMNWAFETEDTAPKE